MATSTHIDPLMSRVNTLLNIIRAVASQSQVICIHALHDEHNDIPKRSSGGRGPLQRKEALHFET